MLNIKLLKPELLAITTRGNSTECLHYGWICVLDKSKKIIYKKGDISNFGLLRSSLKPIQAIPLIEYKVDIIDKEIALACASHTGSRKHIKALSAFIKKYNLKLSNLKCGIHYPSDEDEKNRLIRGNLKPNSLHNNCSGKHLGMLVVCKKNNWDLNNYLCLNHPIQKFIVNKIIELSECNKLQSAIDGCSLPTFAIPILNIATMFSNFTVEEKNKYKRIIQAMSLFPFFIGGSNQLDTEIIKSSNGRILAKVGAEGIIVLASRGNSIVIKIADGSPKARSFVAINLLIKLGWLKKSEIINSILNEIYNGEIKNHVGLTVGKLKFIWAKHNTPWLY